ncbi:hypothetical protein PENNAL_c0190G00760 [Penicillium nalgiovense]|uniref:Uncharacterized protein n=1 Tax=Penicillium nalgiovense TaxID=60175 RepID=A0A1V6WTY4_PENNA|nr:hypothetical protein PENNAL_c0190G00760 [Penicillium nalgiovense]
MSPQLPSPKAGKGPLRTRRHLPTSESADLLPRNKEESTTSFSIEDFQPRVTVISLSPLFDSRERTRNGNAFTPSEDTDRATIREVWRLIGSLKDIIHHQITLIESTKAEVQEVNHDQNVLRDQSEKLHEEVKALRTQIEILPQVTPTRSWATVATNGGVPPPQLTRQQTDKDQSAGGNTADTSPPIPNTHIRTALLSAPSTQHVKFAGIGTTKIGYMIQFKTPNVRHVHAIKHALLPRTHR